MKPKIRKVPEDNLQEKKHLKSRLNKLEKEVGNLKKRMSEIEKRLQPNNQPDKKQELLDALRSKK